MNVSTVGSYIRRAAKLYPDFVLGTGNEPFTKALQKTVEGRKAANQSYLEAVWAGTKKGVSAAEAHNAQMIKRDGNFWKSTWKALKTTPKKVRQGWAAGGRIADNAGKTGLSKFWSQFKGSMGGLGKRMPLVGTLMAIGFEIPNLYSAFKDEGLAGGLIETGKAGLRLGAGMTGAAIGQALIPIPVVGGLVGYFAGDWLMSLVTGKSHSEKKAEAQEKQQALLEQQQQMMQGMMPQMSGQMGTNQPSLAFNQFSVPQPTMTPQQLMAMQQQLYGGRLTSPMDQDFMAMTSGLNKVNYMC